MNLIDRFRAWLNRPLDNRLANTLADNAKFAQTLRTYEARLIDLEAAVPAKLEAERFIQDQFDRARWEIIPTLFNSSTDQAARREQIGALYAYSQVWARLGHEIPDDIGNMILVMSGRKEVKENGNGNGQFANIPNIPRTPIS